ANLIVTVLFIFVIIYWITVILGAIDMDFIDIDVDVDADVDIDLDIDVDAEVDAGEPSVAWLNSILAFFGLGQIPFMIFMSFLIVPAWALSLIVNDYLGISSFVPGLIILAGVLFVSLFIAKILTIPFIKIFGRLGKEVGERKQKLVGKVCEIMLTTTKTKTGQAKIVTDGAPHIINVNTISEDTLSKGDTALVLEYSENRNVYLIEPYNQ
ncbi:MAG: hypothetical protein AAFN93_21465, partial [Bacteroidota bacterium]